MFSTLHSRCSYWMILPIVAVWCTAVFTPWGVLQSSLEDRFCVQYVPRIDTGSPDRLAACTRLIDSDPNSAKFYLYRAYNQAEDDLAVADLEQAIRLDPNNSEARYAHFNRCRDRESLDRAIELNPRYFDALFVRSLDLESASRTYEEQIRDMSAAIRLDPYNNVAYSYRCMWYYDSGDKVSAQRDMFMAQRKPLWTDSCGTMDWTQEMCNDLGSHPDQSSISEAVGLLGEATDPDLETNGSRGLQQVRDSIKLLDQEIERTGGQDGDAFFVRALARYTKRDVEGSLADINRAIAIDGTTISSCVFRSVVLAELKRYEEAHRDVSYVIELAPDRAALYFIRATCSIGLGKKQDAERDLLDGCMRSGVSLDDAKRKFFAGQQIEFFPNFRRTVSEWF